MIFPSYASITMFPSFGGPLFFYLFVLPLLSLPWGEPTMIVKMKINNSGNHYHAAAAAVVNCFVLVSCALHSLLSIRNLSNQIPN